MKQYLISVIFLILFFFRKKPKCFWSVSKVGSVYKINRKLEGPLTVGLFGASFLGFDYLRSKPNLKHDEILHLNADDIWWFDRPATRQDVSFRHKAHDISDFFLNSSIILPGFLALDNTIRKDWLDLLILYAESHAINTDFYLLTSSFIYRTRPFNYNPEVPLEEN